MGIAVETDLLQMEAKLANGITAQECSGPNGCTLFCLSLLISLLMCRSQSRLKLVVLIEMSGLFVMNGSFSSILQLTGWFCVWFCFVEFRI